MSRPDLYEYAEEFDAPPPYSPVSRISVTLLAVDLLHDTARLLPLASFAYILVSARLRLPTRRDPRKHACRRVQ